LGRARRRVLVLDDGQPRNRFASHMHTVLGHEGTDPAALLVRGRAEAAGYDVQLSPGRAVALTASPADGGQLLELTTTTGSVVVGRTAVVATGVTDRLPEIPGLAERWGRSVLHCPYCHGWEVRGQRLGVLVTGPVGFHQAQLIRQWSEHLVVFTGMHDVPAELERRLRSRGIEIVTGPVDEVLGDGHQVTAVRTSGGTVTEVDAIFTASTLEPNDAFLAPLALERTELPMGMGSFLAVDPFGRTSNERVWAVGNVANPSLGVAASMGAGTLAGGAVNMALITEEFDAAELTA
ncbi:MAG: NAD(P)/FAD-dependent oxidoreductase, partial [Actinomycetota bacterium]|nr:NAD(P)/FAD-dependent oxidoreductase [Actinomycetota bacterium]